LSQARSKSPNSVSRIEALLAERKSVPETEREHCSILRVCRRNWLFATGVPGDRFWPAHTKGARKVKELLSDRHIAGAEKGRWPVAVAEGLGLVWMRGFFSARRPPACLWFQPRALHP